MQKYCGGKNKIVITDTKLLESVEMIDHGCEMKENSEEIVSIRSVNIQGAVSGILQIVSF
jgi:hypothetical protein